MDLLKDKRGYFWLITRRVCDYIAGAITNRISRILLFLKGVNVHRSSKFRGIPFIKRNPMSIIKIGKNCTFNSLKKKEGLYLNRPCSFITLYKGNEIILGDNVGCTGVSFVSAQKITVGNNVLLGYHTIVTDTDFHHSDPSKRSTHGDSRPVTIQNNVFVGMNTTILKGVTIGENSAIGANSVVMSNIPANSIALGNPCKVIMKRNWGKSENNK